MRRLKTGHTVQIDRPFCIFVTPADNCWLAHIAGHGLDNVTQSGSEPHAGPLQGPVGAVEMALDLLNLLAGRCDKDPRGEHDYSVDSFLGRLPDEDLSYLGPDDDLPWIYDIPAWKCSKCAETASKCSFEEVEG